MCSFCWITLMRSTSISVTLKTKIDFPPPNIACLSLFLQVLFIYCTGVFKRWLVKIDCWWGCSSLLKWLKKQETRLKYSYCMTDRQFIRFINLWLADINKLKRSYFAHGSEFAHTWMISIIIEKQTATFNKLLLQSGDCQAQSCKWTHNPTLAHY